MTTAGAEAEGAVVVIGGTSGLGLEVARHYAEQDRPVVITGRDLERTKVIAAELGPNASIASLDLTKPHDIATNLADVGPFRYLVIAAIERDQNTVADYDIEGAIRLTTLKLIGYTEVIHALLPRIDRENGSILLFGGTAKERPYPGSTTVTTINGGVVGMMTTLVTELKPLRINVIHPGHVVDSPYWSDKSLDHVLARTPTGRLVTMADIVHASVFLLENRSVNGVDLTVDGGWLRM